MAQGFEVKVSGPLFTHGSGAVREGLHDAVNELMLRAEREATQMAQPAPGGVFHTREYAAAHGYFQTGHYSRSINGRMVSNLHGVVSDSGVVYGSWLEGTSSRNTSTRFKGYSIFRKTRQKIESMVDGVLRKHVGSIARRLS